MATSGTTAFNLDILELIEEAYENVGVETRNGYDIKTARRSLDLLMREWSNRQINMWALAQTSVEVIAGTSSLGLAADAIDVLDVSWRTLSGTTYNDRNLGRIGMGDYAAITNKQQTGTPAQFFVSRINPAPLLYLWPVPDVAATLVYWRVRTLEDVGRNGDHNMDVPTRFLPAMAAGLAFYLAKKTPAASDRLPMLQEEYERQLGYAFEEDRDRSTLRIVPGDMSGYYR